MRGLAATCCQLRGSLSAPVTRRENTRRSTPRPHPAIPGCATKQSVHSAWRAPEAGAVGVELPPAPPHHPRPSSATGARANSATETPRLQEQATPRSAHARRASPLPPPRRARGRAAASHLVARSPGPTRAGRTASLPWNCGLVRTRRLLRLGRCLQHSSRRSCLRHRGCSARASQSVIAERGWERAGRAATAGGRRCAQRGRGAAAASASRAGRAPGGRRRRRGLRVGDRVGPGGGSLRAAPANRVAGFRARSLARRHAHTRGRVGGGSGARRAPDPRAQRVARAGRGARGGTLNAGTALRLGSR